jgi:hypothetical protein
MLRQASKEYQSFWTSHLGDDLLVQSPGQTDLATPLVEALAWGAELVVVVSDGYDNAPPGAFDKIFRAYQNKLDNDRKTAVIHVNPVFDSENYAPKTLGESLPTVGLYNAEDLMTMLGFARFAAGFAPLEELEEYPETRMAGYLSSKQISGKRGGL